MTRYRTPSGSIVDEDDLEDAVYAAFTEDDFRRWLDSNYSGFDYDRYHIPASEVLDVMGEFDYKYRETVDSIVSDYGSDYPSLSDLGFEELDDEDDESYSKRPKARPKASKPKSKGVRR